RLQTAALRKLMSTFSVSSACTRTSNAAGTDGRGGRPSENGGIDVLRDTMHAPGDEHVASAAATGGAPRLGAVFRSHMFALLSSSALDSVAGRRRGGRRGPSTTTA
ncbi:MAG: hypothetical protein ACPIOQ_53170, partial [Promethearchaeia archaeon]